MAEPWNSIIAVIVGLPLCAAGALAVLALTAGLCLAPYIDEREEDL